MIVNLHVHNLFIMHNVLIIIRLYKYERLVCIKKICYSNLMVPTTNAMPVISDFGTENGLYL